MAGVSTKPVILGASAELRRLVRSWRLRLDPLSIAGLGVDALHRQTVSQEQMAHLVGSSTVWYGRLERGERANYSEDFLERVSYTLQLNDDERTVLFLLTVGREPVPRVRASSTAVNEVLRRVVQRQPWPAYISDQAWDVIVHNRHMAEWFPHFAYELNIMRWVYYYPQSKLQLIDWETSWAPLMLAQMRAAHARWPDNQRLADLIHESLQVNQFARELWDKDPKVYVHPDGDRRRLNLPWEQGVREIEIVALTPMRADDLRLVMLIPVQDTDLRPP